MLFWVEGLPQVFFALANIMPPDREKYKNNLVDQINSC